MDLSGRLDSDPVSLRHRHSLDSQSSPSERLVSDHPLVSLNAAISAHFVPSALGNFQCLVTVLAVVAKAWHTNTSQIARRAVLLLSVPRFVLTYELVRLLTETLSFVGRSGRLTRRLRYKFGSQELPNSMQ